MIFLKNEKEIALIRESGAILAKTLGLIAEAVKAGIKIKMLDTLAEKFIRAQGAIPSFKGYKKFPGSLCLSVNETIVHGIPDNYILKEGDIISVDCGVYYKGFHSDSAYTFGVGEITEEAKKLIKVTKESLYLGILQAVVGKTLGDIGAAVNDHAIAHRYTVVKQLAGHGVGRYLHEEPLVPNYGTRGRGITLQKGMVIAIEPMVNQGVAAVRHSKDGWRVTTADKKLSAHFEHTIAVDEQKADILTSYEYIDKVLNS